jgi:hypothetical protein
MKKSETIARVMVNSNVVKSVIDADLKVRKVFEVEFPDSNFAVWNKSLHPETANAIIKTIGIHSNLDVKKLIEALDKF